MGVYTGIRVGYHRPVFPAGPVPENNDGTSALHRHTEPTSDTRTFSVVWQLGDEEIPTSLSGTPSFRLAWQLPGHRNTRNIRRTLVSSQPTSIRCWARNSAPWSRSRMALFKTLSLSSRALGGENIVRRTPTPGTSNSNDLNNLW